MVGDGLDGEDVPGVGGDYVGGDEVDLVGAVGDSVGGDAATVGVPAFLLGAFDLDAAEAAAVVGGEVVGGGVSPGRGDAEAELGGAGHETELRPLAAGFGVLDIHSFNCHEYLRDFPGAFGPARIPRLAQRTREKWGTRGFHFLYRRCEFWAIKNAASVGRVIS